MKTKKIKQIIIFLIAFFTFSNNANALTGIINVNDNLSLRTSPNTSSTILTKFYNGTEVEILNKNAGSGNGCDDNWYQIKYGNYTGYSCGTFINIVSNDSNNTKDESYNSGNYDNGLTKDGSVMCYEDTGSITLRSSANGAKLSGKTVDCGQEVNIEAITETKGATCPYWYKVNTGSYSGYMCGYYVNTTKLSTTATNYYNNNSAGDTIDNYKTKLTNAGFPVSYHNYLLEIHARYPKWVFQAEQINLTFDEVVAGENYHGRSLLQGSAFDQGYISTEAHSYNILTNTFYQYASEPGYYNASREAIAYYMDPRNYLNEKYIFAFESLGYSNNQTNSVISSIISGQSFFNTIYSRNFGDGTGSASGDIVKSSSEIGISAVHVASRIKQEMGNSLTTSDSRLGGNFTYNGSNHSGYYNFFNIKSSCKNCSSIYSGYAFEKGWNTPYKGIRGGASFMYDGYISLNQDTIYYEKFDVSTTNGNYTHQYMQNLAAPVQEGGIKYKGYVQGFASYLDTAITFVIPVYKDMPEHTVTAPKLGNPNNYLSKLTVNGKEVSNFSYDTYNYNVTLSSGAQTATIGATAMQSTSSVEGIGTIKIESTEQTEIVKVKSQNGKYRNYTITFTKKDSKPTTIDDSLNNSGFKYNSNNIFGINVGTNVSSFIGNIRDYNDTTEVTIKSSSGQIKTNDSFRTGDKITLTASNETKTYEVIIYGDVDGDGEITKTDLLRVQRDVFGYGALTGVYKSASDINKDGKTDKTDLLQVQRDVFGYASIKQ